MFSRFLVVFLAFLGVDKGSSKTPKIKTLSQKVHVEKLIPKK
jgi:hypothetical protein